MKIAVTGHRKQRLRGKEEAVAAWLKEQVQELSFAERRVECICGGAEGADEIYAEVVAFADDIAADLVFYLPCEGYRFFALEKFMDKASRVVNVFSKWTAGGDTIRDRKMVDNCDVLLAVWDGIRVGGTWDTIKYARENRKKIIYIPEEILK